MNFYCTICCIQTKNKRNFDIHNASLRHKLKEDSINNNETTVFKHICYCGKCFTKRPNLYRHHKKCEVFKNQSSGNSNNEQSQPTILNTLVQQTQWMAQTIQKKDSQIDQLTKQVALLLENAQSNQATTNHTTMNTTNNNDNSTNTTNHIETQNVIVVNSFGNENTEYLTDRIVSKLIANGPFTCLPKIIERIHFDPEHPENHNIKITNQKNNYAKVVKDNKWVTTNKKRAIDAMIQNSYDILEEKYQDNKASIPPFKQERFESFQEKYTNQDKELMRNVKDDVDIALLNGTETIYKRGT